MTDPLAGPGQSRASDPESSKVAAQLVTAKATSARVRLLEAHELYAVTGLTDLEACRIAGLSEASEYATRCSELTRAGLLAADGRELRIAAGTLMPRMVRRITDAGIAVLEQRRAAA